MRITALKPQERNPERVNVFVDGTFRCRSAYEIAYGASLRVGDEVSEELLASLERKDTLWKAREAALNLLSYRARTRSELEQRLRRKEFPEDVVEACVSELVEKGPWTMRRSPRASSVTGSVAGPWGAPTRPGAPRQGRGRGDGEGNGRAHPRSGGRVGGRVGP